MNLRVSLGELRLRNPIMLAAGILGLTGSSLKRVWEAGAGATVAKSVSEKVSEGYSGPRIVQVRGGLLNAVGLPSPGVENMVKELETAKKAGATVIGSVYGEDEMEFAAVGSRVEKAVDAIELNLSCPHAETLSIIGHDPKLVKKVIRQVKSDVKIPVWAKLPGNTHIPNFIDVARAAESAGADALTISNSFPAITLDSDAGRAILGHGVGGLSGPAIKPISMRLVYEAYENVEIPIIGCGGIVEANDVIEYFLSGASAVQIGTGILYRGLEIFEELCSEIRSYMKRKEIEEVSEMIGIAKSK